MKKLIATDEYKLETTKILVFIIEHLKGRTISHAVMIMGNSRVLMVISFRKIISPTLPPLINSTETKLTKEWRNKRSSY